MKRPPANMAGVESGLSLSALEASAEDAMAHRDALEKTDAPAEQLGRANLRAMRIVGLVLTIAGNCATVGKASCEDAAPVSERIVHRWLFKGLADKLQSRGWADWQASALYAFTAQAHTDSVSLLRRIEEVEHGLIDEKLKAAIRSDVLPAAQKSLNDLQAALQRLPDLERAEVLLVVLRAALPGARKRPEAHVVLVEHAKTPIAGPAAEARQHFLFALKQIVTATTGTDVCDGTATTNGCLGGARASDARLVLTFAPLADRLHISAELELTNSGAALPGVTPAQKARSVSIALGNTRAACNVDALVSRSATAAWSLMKSLEWSYNNVLGDVAHLRIDSHDVALPIHTGVHIDELSKTFASVTHTGDVSIMKSGSCAAPQFYERVKRRLIAGFGRALVEPNDRTTMQLTLSSDRSVVDALSTAPDVLTGALEAARPRLASDNWCLAELSSGARSLYRALVRVKQGPLSAEAGSDLGTYLGERLNLYLPRTTASKPPPPLPPPASTGSGWYALSFAGTPYLQDDRATTWSQIVPSALDGLLLTGAGISFGLAIHYGNEHAEDPRAHSAHPATIARNAGIVLSASLLVTRIVSGIVYEKADFWKRSGP